MVKKTAILFVLFFICYSSSSILNAASDFELYFSRGVLKYEEKSFEEALSLLEKAKRLKPKDIDVLYYLGLTYTQLGKVEKSIEVFEKALEISPKNGDIHYQLGICYITVSNWDKAISHLKVAKELLPEKEEIPYFIGYAYYKKNMIESAKKYFLESKPKEKKILALTHYYLGICEFKSYNLTKAKKEFIRTKEVLPGTYLSRSAQKFIDYINSLLRAKRRYSIYASASFQYDDNIIVAPDGKVPGISGKDKTDTKEVLLFRGAYKIVNRKNTTLTSSYSFFQTLANTLSDTDTQNHIVMFSLDKTVSKARLSVQYFFTYTYLDYDSYMRSQNGRITFSHFIGKKWLNSIIFRVKHKDYFKNLDFPGENRDATNYQFGVIEYLFLKKNFQMKFGYLYDWERARGRNWDYNGEKFILGFNMPILFFRCSFDVDYHIRNYLHKSTLFGTARDDKEWDISFSLTKKIKNGLDLSIGYLRVRQDSNIHFFDYDRNICSLTLSYQF